MAKGDSLSGFKQVTMLALARLRDDAYGEANASSNPQPANWPPTAPGRAKRYFRLIGAGVAALEESCRLLTGMMKGVRRATGSFTW